MGYPGVQMSSNLVHTALYSLTVAFFILSTSCTTPVVQNGPSADAQQKAGGAQEEKTGTAADDRPEEARESADETVQEGGERPGLPAEEIFRLSRRTIPDRFLLIEEGGRPVSLFYDLDGNGYRDAMYLLVERSDSLAGSEASGEAAEKTKEQDATEEELREERRRELLESWYRRGSVPKEAISSVSRIYADRLEPVDYYLSVFLQTPDELVSMYRIPLGAWKVLEGFRSVEIIKKSKMPYCVSSSFQTADGKERVWVIFSKYNKFSTLTLTDTVSEHSEQRDIDDDGVLDVIEWSQIFEEGTGYETFLTWFKWNGTKFVQHQSANIVRSLNDFLSTAGRLLQAGAWEKAFGHMMSPRDYERYRSEGYDYSRLFSLLFEEEAENGEERAAAADAGEAADGDGADSPPQTDTPEELIAEDGSERAFQLVVFPRVMENPFRRYVESGEGPPYRVRLAARFSVGTSRKFVRYCTVQMDENPFNTPQFFLVPEE